jgi:hypothetical protein
MGDVPEQVYLDAARALIEAQRPIAATDDPAWLDGSASQAARGEGLRAAVASAYRARQAATPDGPRRWALPDDRETAKTAIHRPLHDLNVRIVGIPAGDCHCNLIAEVVLDALTDASPAADGQDGDGRG